MASTGDELRRRFFRLFRHSAYRRKAANRGARTTAQDLATYFPTRSRYAWHGGKDSYSVGVSSSGFKRLTNRASRLIERSTKSRRFLNPARRQFTKRARNVKRLSEPTSGVRDLQRRPSSNHAEILFRLATTVQTTPPEQTSKKCGDRDCHPEVLSTIDAA